jgi:hypothetical protein
VPEPHQLATFDQAFALVNERLDDLIAAHRVVLAEDAAAPEIDIAGMGVFLRANTDHDAAAELLAVAIHRLAKDSHA